MTSLRDLLGSKRVNCICSSMVFLTTLYSQSISSVQTNLSFRSCSFSDQRDFQGNCRIPFWYWTQHATENLLILLFSELFKPPYSLAIRSSWFLTFSTVRTLPPNSTWEPITGFFVFSFRLFLAANCKNFYSFSSSSSLSLAYNIQSSMFFTMLSSDSILESPSVIRFRKAAELQMPCGRLLKVNLPILVTMVKIMSKNVCKIFSDF